MASYTDTVFTVYISLADDTSVCSFAIFFYDKWKFRFVFLALQLWHSYLGNAYQFLMKLIIWR